MTQQNSTSALPKADITAIWIPGHPSANHRPRFGSRGSVKAPDYAAWVEQVGWYAKQQVNRSIEGAVVLVITFYLDDVYMQDIDNLVKGIMDGLQGILYKNDKAVTDLLTTKIDRPGHEGVAVLAWDVTNPPPGYWDFYKSMFLAYVPETKGVQ